MVKKRTFEIDLTETFPHLAGAPILEAVIHWEARAGKELSKEELNRELVKRLPDFPEIHPQRRLKIQAEFAGDGMAAQTQHEAWHGYRLTSSDQLHIIQFTRDGVVFSRLAPYADWDSLLAEAWHAWSAYVELAQPTEVQRLGVRFINRIVLGDESDLVEVLREPPPSLDELGLSPDAFLFQSSYNVPGQPFRIQAIQTIQRPLPPQVDDLGLILDIDVGVTRVLACDDRELREHLAKMHWLKNKIFFSLVSKKAIKQFKKGKP